MPTPPPERPGPKKQSKLSPMYWLDRMTGGLPDQRMQKLMALHPEMRPDEVSPIVHGARTSDIELPPEPMTMGKRQRMLADALKPR